jgi:hypothetical protein
MHLDLTDEEAAARIKELADISRNDLLSSLGSYPDPEGHPL